MKSGSGSILIWQCLKFGLLLLLFFLIPAYWHYYGLENFLWLSDIGLFLTFLALWLESGLLMSIAATGMMLVELAWCVDFFIDLIFGLNLISLSDYMFNSSYPLWLRAVSLFHVVTPIIWILYLRQFGYVRQAIWYVLIGYLLVLGITFYFTLPAENINWVFLPTVIQGWPISQKSWPIFLAITFPLAIFIPTHLLCRKLFRVI